MPEYKKIGYLTSDFKMFHLRDEHPGTFHYHYHDFHKILILLEGDVSYCIEGRTYDLQKNDIVVIHSGEVHKPVIQSGHAYERIIIYISPDFLNQYSESENDLSVCFQKALKEHSHVLRIHSFANSRLGSVAKSLDQSLHDTDYASGLHHKILFLEFLIQLNRAALHNKIEFIETSASSDKILAILSYLNGHLTESITIDDLSSRFYLSRYYLMHTFREQTGYSIGSYLSTKRLLLAREMILSGRPITDICYECGFKNYSTFSRAYKKCFGESPREFRQSISKTS